MTRHWPRWQLVAGLLTVIGAAAGCGDDGTGPEPVRRPQLVFAEVDTGTFTVRLMGYSAQEGVWELAPGPAKLPEPMQEWYLRPTSGEVLYSGVLADLARGTYTQLTSSALDDIGRVLEWSPAGDWLLVLLRDGQTYSLLDPQSWTLTGLTFPGPPDCNQPSFTPDGQFLIQDCALGPTGSTFDVIRWSVAGGEQANLTDTPGLSERNWGYSPDMQRVAFYRDGVLLLANADGSGVHSLSQIAFGHFAWAPDGKQLATRVNVDGVIRIAILPLEGLARFVTPPSASGGGTNSVWWSPDGTQLAYDAFDDDGDGELSLFVINTDGSGLRRLNRGGTFANIAAWYPTSAP